MSFKSRLVNRLIYVSAASLEKGKLKWLSLVRPSCLGYAYGCLFSHLLPLPSRQTKNILCFDRFVFARDLKVLHEKGKHNYLSFQSGLLGCIFSLYIPKWMQTQVLCHHFLQEQPELLNKLVDFSEGFLKAIQKKRRIDVFLLAGIDYFSDYSFHIVSSKLNIPLIALFYEHYTIPFIRQSNTHLYKDLNFKFTGDAIACFGEKTAQVFREAGVIDEHKIHVTGSPRYDVWRNTQDSNLPLDTLLLFSYPGIEYGAPLNFEYVLVEFAKSSFANQHLHYVVKCKDKHHADQVYASLRGLDHNLTITFSEPIENILKRARAVFSFNSLTCIEALLTRANVYIPHFMDAKLPEPMLQITPQFTDISVQGLFFMESIEEFHKALEKECVADTRDYQVTTDRVSVFGTYFHFDQETSAEKLDNIVDSL